MDQTKPDGSVLPGITAKKGSVVIDVNFGEFIAAMNQNDKLVESDDPENISAADISKKLIETEDLPSSPGQNEQKISFSYDKAGHKVKLENSVDPSAFEVHEDSVSNVAASALDILSTPKMISSKQSAKKKRRKFASDFKITAGDISRKVAKQLNMVKGTDLPNWAREEDERSSGLILVLNIRRESSEALLVAGAIDVSSGAVIKDYF